MDIQTRKTSLINKLTQQITATKKLLDYQQSAFDRLKSSNKYSGAYLEKKLQDIQDKINDLELQISDDTDELEALSNKNHELHHRCMQKIQDEIDEVKETHASQFQLRQRKHQQKIERNKLNKIKRAEEREERIAKQKIIDQEIEDKRNRGRERSNRGRGRGRGGSERGRGGRGRGSKPTSHSSFMNAKK